MSFTLKQKRLSIVILFIISFVAIFSLTFASYKDSQFHLAETMHATEELRHIRTLSEDALELSHLLEEGLKVTNGYRILNNGQNHPLTQDSLIKAITPLEEHLTSFGEIYAQQLTQKQLVTFTQLIKALHEDFTPNILDWDQRVNDTANTAKVIGQMLDFTYNFSQFLAGVHIQLENQLQSELSITAENSEFFHIAEITVYCLVFCIFFGVLFTFLNSLIKTLTSLTQQTLAMQEGHLRNEILEKNHKDEIGQFALSLDHLRKKVFEANRKTSALNFVKTNVMIADENMDVIYLNPSAQEMFEEAEDDLQTEIKGFSAQKVIGQSIDRFHKNPGQQRQILEQLETTYTVDIPVGKRTFSLLANPVLNQFQERIGYVVEWLDITQQLNIQKELANIVQLGVAGDFSRRLDLDNKTGFMHELSESMNRLMVCITHVNEIFADFMTQLSQGNLEARIDQQFDGSFGKLCDDANQMAQQLTHIVSRSVIASHAVSNAAAEISAGSLDFSERTEQQAASLEETAAAMEELATTVRKNSDNAQDADAKASNASNIAKQGGQVVQDAVSAMSNIQTSSQKIADIIAVIDEIAFQTNLLALNAAVEAARAGEAGKGFAVVAAEVRTLAQRSAEASKEIKSLIAESTSQVNTGVNMVHETGTALDKIVNAVSTVSDIVADIAAASKEQTMGLEEINTAITLMDDTTQKNASLIEENASSARSLDEQARDLSQLMSFFKLSQISPPSHPTTEAHTPSASYTPAPNATLSASAFPPSKQAGANNNLSFNGHLTADEQDNWEEF